MRYFTLEKQALERFVTELKKKYKTEAPIKKENQFVFGEFDSFSEICLEHIPTILPPKKYFLPQHEELLRFMAGDVKSEVVFAEKKPMVIFGMNTCDIAGIACLGTIFHNEPYDCYFSEREKSIIIIGYECMKPCDDKATCLAMDTLNPRGFYDIMITDAGKNYIFHINSPAGLEIVNATGLFRDGDDKKIKAELQELRKKKLVNFKNILNAEYSEFEKIFGKSYDSKVWNENGKKCLSCGNCTNVCPTCYCFNIYDTVDLKLEKGARSRVWDSCQLDEFAVVAGGHDFRKERSSRQRHRFYRKFSYPVPKYNRYFCVGCGRCTRTCMAGISLIDTVNGLAKEYRNA